MPDAYEVVPLSPLRKVIAARMVEAKRTIPHFRISTAVTFDALIELRRQLRAQAEDCPLSLNDMLLKACAAALMDVPGVNVQWAEQELHQYRSADISVVTAIEGGLATPILRNAEAKTVWQIAREVRDLTTRAARNALKASEVFGGSFSVSNLGMFNVEDFDAIINPPQCAILAIGAARPSVVAGPDLEMRVATVARVTLSVDHRAVDGKLGAAFLAAFKRRVESPDHMRAAAEI
jgi:pyruvate dehydrogenase E2 component (dihydrolipoamide acetyltransferase)